MNLVIIKGNTTRDVELRYLPNGTPVGQFAVAVNRKWKDNNGELREEVTFVDVECWGKTAETIAKFFGKGSPILVNGRLKQDTWDDKQTGQKRHRMKVVLNSFEFCGDTKAAAGGGEGAQPNNQYDEAPQPDGDDAPF